MDKATLTTIQINKETNQNLREIKHKFHYKSNNDLVNDMSRYFIEYNVSPREASQPIFDQFKTIDKTFRSFFKEYENKLFKPFVNAQSQVNLRVLEFMENSSKIEEIDNLNSDIKSANSDDILVSKNDLKKVEKMIEILHDKIFRVQKQETRDNNTYYLIHTYDYFALKDALNDIKIKFE
ncbi:BfmA/BtgA family mobilization protein [Chryseobacterium potabilaquae]|uniref:Uncharacterized protein n=1 Tax=Chryseobacterium potabilaquae TaxID=2675057 RepID=A0A6N4XCX2_9FLAO|nr:BfmA/BtgA family mobilization protein [Chryseobacterium potabilaquae]CAA7197589.1 hypothetical protein CHRY9293_03656 [Chryseobacterium potabilaquae]